MTAMARVCLAALLLAGAAGASYFLFTSDSPEGQAQGDPAPIKRSIPKTGNDRNRNPGEEKTEEPKTEEPKVEEKAKPAKVEKPKDVEKATLGDLESLAALKEQLEEGEKKKKAAATKKVTKEAEAE